MNIEITEYPLLIRSVRESDREAYMIFRKVEGLAGSQKLDDYMWNRFCANKDGINFIAYHMDSKDPVGKGDIHNTDSKSIEIGYDVIPGKQNCGYGTIIAKSLIKISHDLFPGKPALLKIRKDNYASLRVAEKCGGVLLRTEDGPEVEYTLGKIKDFEANRPEWLTDEKMADLQESINKGKNAVLVFQMP